MSVRIYNVTLCSSRQTHNKATDTWGKWLLLFSCHVWKVRYRQAYVIWPVSLQQSRDKDQDFVYLKGLHHQNWKKKRTQLDLDNPIIIPNCIWLKRNGVFGMLSSALAFHYKLPRCSCWRFYLTAHAILLSVTHLELYYHTHANNTGWQHVKYLAAHDTRSLIFILHLLMQKL